MKYHAGNHEVLFAAIKEAREEAGKIKEDKRHLMCAIDATTEAVGQANAAVANLLGWDGSVQSADNTKVKELPSNVKCPDNIDDCLTAMEDCCPDPNTEGMKFNPLVAWQLFFLSKQLLELLIKQIKK